MKPLSIALVLSLAFMINISVYAGDDDEDPLVKRGFAISPVPKAHLKFKESDRERVGLGSFIVNAIGNCSICHSFPQFLAKGDTEGSNPAAGDPFLGLPTTQSAIVREFQRKALSLWRAVLRPIHVTQFDAG